MLGYLRKDYQGVIKALGDGSMHPDKMITSKIHIDRVVEDGFTPLINVSDPVLANRKYYVLYTDSSSGEGEACKDIGRSVSLRTRAMKGGDIFLRY